jgi:hypothetical protein
VSGRYNQTRTNRQQPFGTTSDSLLNSLLNLRSEKSPVRCINPAIHESVTVRRRNQAVFGDGNNVSGLNSNLRKLTEGVSPSGDNVCIRVNEV